MRKDISGAAVSYRSKQRRLDLLLLITAVKAQLALTVVLAVIGVHNLNCFYLQMEV